VIDIYAISSCSYIFTFLAALISLFKNDKKYTAILSTSSLILALLLIVYTAIASKSSTHIETYSWQPLGNVGFQLDGLSLSFSVIICLVGSMISVYSYYFMDKQFEFLGPERWSAFYFLYLTFIFGMLGTVLSNNLLEFYIFFELMLIPSYFLIAEFGNTDRSRASFSYFLWTHVGALVMLAGLIAVSFHMELLI